MARQTSKPSTSSANHELTQKDIHTLISRQKFGTSSSFSFMISADYLNFRNKQLQQIFSYISNYLCIEKLLQKYGHTLKVNKNSQEFALLKRSKK